MIQTMKPWGYIGSLVFGFALGAGLFACFVVQTPVVEAAALTPEEKARLQAEYDQLQQEIAQWQKVLDETKAKKNTLTGDVTALDAQIKKAQAEINQRNNTITTLGSEIQEKTKNISTLEARLQAGRESLAKLMREKYETEQQSLVVLALSSETLSGFFGDVQSIDVINGSLQDLFNELRGVKTETEQEKAALDARKNAELDARYVVQQKQNQIKEDQNEKKQLLAITTKDEKAYSQVLADRQARAAEIRSALFDLRDSQGISFDTALKYATAAERATGVRAAMVLAILSQESDLGKNIGSCLVTSLETGDGKGKNTGAYYEKVMKSPRDTKPFEEITSAAGLDWQTTPVSCPLGKTYTASRGYGGAMGPSQFIPSTWVLYEPRLRSALGVQDPNPWNAAHAVMATALYLKDLGAAAQTYTAERNAACKYYSGRSCDSRTPTNYTYGNSVVAKAETFQNNIDFLNDL